MYSHNEIPLGYSDNVHGISCQYAIRAKKKGRAKGGIIIGVRKGIEEINVEKTKAINGIQERRMRLEGRFGRIISVYNNSMKSERREIEEMLGDLEEEILCIGGDFNVRIGKEGKRIEGEEDEEPWRNSKDEKVTNKGRELLDLMEDREWDIANGNVRGNENGELTYIGGRGESIIDYVLVNQKAWDKIEKTKIGNRVESDHQSLEIEIRIKRKRGIENCKVERKKIVEWGEENIELYRQREEGMRVEGESVEEIWESLKKGVNECETRKEIKIRKKDSASIAGGTQSVKGTREKYTRRTEDGRKEDEVRRSTCV